MGAFSSLTDKLQKAFSKLTGKGRLTEEEVVLALKEVQLALLEADVNFKVVKEFIKNIKIKAIGKDVMESLTPGQHVVDLVHQELVTLLGGESKSFLPHGKKPFVVLLAGLQGSGKTTTAAKIAYYLKTQNKKSFFIALDIYRPAAIEQLRTLAGKMSLPIYYDQSEKNISTLLHQGMEAAKIESPDVILIDTAGRTHLDEGMMNELIDIKKEVMPDETLLVVDGMTGQDAVNIGREFSEHVGIDGLVVTKMDGDARGGAIISLKAITGMPVKFIGVGEKIDQLEFFHPDRIAGRILGMGDVLTLIEKAKASVDQKEALEMQKKILESSFTFEDFLSQIKQMRNLGSLEDILGMLPGAGKLKGLSMDDRELDKIEAIIFSMTRDERKKPALLNGSRKIRIAKGSGTQVQDVNRLVKQFENTKTMMKQFGTMGKKKRGTKPSFF